MKIFNTILFCFIYIFVNSQNSKIDSLSIEVKKMRVDTQLVNELNALANEFRTINFDTAIVLSKKALMLSEKINWKKGIGHSYQRLGVFYEAKGLFDSSKYFSEIALHIFEGLDDRKGISTSYNNLGMAYTGLSCYDIAIDCHNKALEYGELIIDKKTKAAILSNIGRAYRIKGDFDKALFYFQQGMKIYLEINDEPAYARSLGRVGNLYFSIGDLDKAMSYHRKALAINLKNNAFLEQTYNYGNIGAIYSNKGDYSNAIKFIFKSIKIEEKLGEKNGIADDYTNLGDIYLEQDDSDYVKQGLNPSERYLISTQYYLKALNLKREIDAKDGVASAYISMSYLYKLQGDLHLSEKMIDSSLVILKQTQNYSFLISAFKQKFTLDSIKGDFKSALLDFQEFKRLEAILLDKEGIKKRVKAEMNFEFEKKEALATKEKAILELKNKNGRYFSYGLIGFIILLSLFGVLLIRQQKLKAKHEAFFLEQKLLSAQMNPHFIFNALNSIQTYILEKNTEDAYNFLSKFSRLVRLVLNNTKEKVLILEKEIELLKAYIELEQMRFENKFTIEFNIESAIDTYQIELPPMLLQPYIENAIWHGLMPLKDERKGYLKIEMKQINSLLYITVEDNGIGIETSQKINKSPNHVSAGMELTKQRIKAIKTNHSEAKISVQKLTETYGTIIEIIIPI